MFAGCPLVNSGASSSKNVSTLQGSHLDTQGEPARYGSSSGSLDDAIGNLSISAAVVTVKEEEEASADTTEDLQRMGHGVEGAVEKKLADEEDTLLKCKAAEASKVSCVSVN
jgi:hypothetical protein